MHSKKNEDNRSTFRVLFYANGSKTKNLALDNIKVQIIKHYQRISDREAYVTAEMVRIAPTLRAIIRAVYKSGVLQSRICW